METKFSANARSGKNEWWRYALTIFVMVLLPALFIVIFGNLIMPVVKSHFEKTHFSETLITLAGIAGIFLSIRGGLWIAINKLHRRPFSSLIHTKKTFSWKLWICGFLAWCPFVILTSFLFEYQSYKTFISYNWSSTQILLLFFTGLISIGIQSTTEEIVFRGYILQGISLKIKRTITIALINALLFSVLHFGYGIQSLIESFVFGVIITLIVFKFNRIEFAAGAHASNNLILLLFFPSDLDAMSQFEWSVDLLELTVFLLTMILFYVLILAFLRRKIIGITKPALLFFIVIALPQASVSQPDHISDKWIDENVHIIHSNASNSDKFNFLKEKISSRRIVFLGEATHHDGATFAARSEMIDFLIGEMGFNVILFEAGMFDVMQANKEFQQTGQSQFIRKSLWEFWQTQEWQHFYSSIEKHKKNGKSIQVAGFDCKFSSYYGFSNHNYSAFLEGVLKDQKPESTNKEEYKEYISIWRDIENGYQQTGIKGGLAKIRYKMSDEEKIKFKKLSQWMVNEFTSIRENKIAEMVKSNDESIIAYSDIRLLKLVFNKKSIIPINNRRDELMADNIIHLLKRVHPDEKVIVIGATYHFIRNNSLIQPVKIQGIPIHESVIMGNLIYNEFPNEIYTIGFTSYEGMYGLIHPNEKASPVKLPSVNSLEYQLASRGIENAFVSLSKSGNEPFFNHGAVLRLFDHQSSSSSMQWDKAIDAVYFIRTMTPAYVIANP
jgi:erythromycin esterase-like protein/membrane protease YdiL (CAAX protease family)